MKLEVRDIRCGYGEKVVVDGFSSDISSGDIFCLLGPNGVGKTTLFKSILGILPVMNGSIICDGLDLHTLSIKDFAKLIAYVPQAHSPPFAYNVLDVVAMGRTAHLDVFGSPRQIDAEIAYATMGRLGIESLADRIYTELSGGEMQMVLIARALAQESEFLLMDEPTANLDFGNQARVLQTVKILAKDGLGIIMTTHDPDHVFQCNARVALMQRGQKYLYGNAEEIMQGENLSAAYNVDVAVLDVEYQTKRYRMCQPILSDL